MVFIKILVDSFRLLRKCPRLFIPKILIAFLLLPTFILIPHFLIQSNLFAVGQDLTEEKSLQLLEAVVPLFFVVLYGMLVDLFDFFIVNPMYPLMVKSFYRKKNVFFKRAMFDVLQRFGTIFPALLTVLIIVFTVLTPVAILVTVAIFLQNGFLLALSALAGFLAIFVLFVLFYLVYPISSLEEFTFLHSLKETVSASLKHKLNVSKAFLVSIVITGLSYALGFLVALLGSPEQLAPRISLFFLFVLVRILVALFSTYQYVLNAVFYLGLEKGQFLKGA